MVVDFSAAWCEKCKAVEPVVASLGKQARSMPRQRTKSGLRLRALKNGAAPAQHPEMHFVIADADFLPEMAGDIRFTPTFSFYQRGVKARAR